MSTTPENTLKFIPNISDELATFIGQPIGSKMSRIEVTRELDNYIRKHKLLDPHNKLKINPDDKLAGLLKLPDSTELTYCNLQYFMSPHFSKNPTEPEKINS